MRSRSPSPGNPLPLRSGRPDRYLRTYQRKLGENLDLADNALAATAAAAVFVFAVGANAGLYIDRQRHKHYALAEAEREAPRHSAS